MTNYIKSEWYRILHGKELYVTTAVMSGIVLLMNLVLFLFNQMTSEFRYGTVRFSLNTFTAVPFIMIVMGAIVAGCLLIDDRRNGVLRNAIAYGISRTSILIGKCIIGALTALIIMAVVLAVYVGSAYLLLDNPEWLPLREMLSAIGASLLCAVASLVLTLVLGSLLQKEMHVVLWWFAVFYCIPLVTFLIGLKVEPVGKISQWMPYNFLRNEVLVNMSSYQCLWDTPEGLAKCLIAGAVGIIIFLIFGIWRFNKQEL